MARHGRSLTIVLLVAGLAGGCFGAETASPTPPPTGEPAPERRPIIIDTDVSLDDIGAILVMLRDPRLDVRAITIAGTGLARCQGGRLIVRHLIDEMGVPGIPFGCGRDNGGPDARPFPDESRAGAATGYGLAITPKVVSGTPRDAVEILREAVDGSPSAPTVVTLGPLTDLEDAFAADPTLPDRIAGMHAMLGTVATTGNVTIDDVTTADPVEWNAFADPSAVAAVLATDVPITIVPLDATDDVPVPPDLADRLATDRTAGGADLLYELFVKNPFLLDPARGDLLWDALAALTLTDPTLAEWDEARLTAGPRGELIRDDAAGRPVGWATGADRAAVEAAFLEALRRGGPRTTPFVVAGTLTATWDGATCALTPDATTPGYYDLAFTGRSGSPSGVLIVGVRAPQTWADVQALVATVDLETETSPPSWLLQGGQAFDETGSGASIQGGATLQPGTWGPLCLEGERPDMAMTPGDPIAVAD